MKKRCVKITGIGPITPAGSGRDAFWRGVLEPVSRVVETRIHEYPGGGVAAAPVPDFRVGAYALDAIHLDSPRHVQMALAAAVLALRDAGLTMAEVRARRPFIHFAGSVHDRAGAEGVEDADNHGSPVPAAQTAGEAFFHGAAGWQSTGAVPLSGLEAIGTAAQRVATGEADLAICGGAEALLKKEVLDQLLREGLAMPHAREPGRLCRPFDLWRTSGVPGEGACMLVLEPESSPRHAHAHIAGWASVPDAAGRPWSGFEEALRIALGNAGMRTGTIDCIHAQGTGSAQGDAAEAGALVRAFGSDLSGVPAVAIKGALGNALGAAGAIQVACAAPAMKHSLIPPAVNWHTPDPACPLSLAPVVRSVAMDTSLVIERDRRGNSCCLLLRR